MVEVDPVLVGIVAVLLTLIFFLYLFLRRTVTEFRKGLKGGDRGRR